MRKPLVAGNWKMNKTVDQASLLVADLLPGLEAVRTVDRVLCPPFTSLMVVSRLLAATDIGLGAQNMYWEESGAYTGELSVSMVKEFCRYVIIGHSERRSIFAETDESVNLKTKSAIAHGLIPIVCVGETLEENENQQTEEVVSRQVRKALDSIDQKIAQDLIVAYEPVWAIGTGKAASSGLANEIIGGVVRKNLAHIFSPEIAEKIRILYGGSVNKQNAAEFFSQSEIDGGLIGGASLKPEEFLGIVEAAS